MYTDSGHYFDGITSALRMRRDRTNGTEEIGTTGISPDDGEGLGGRSSLSPSSDNGITTCE